MKKYFIIACHALWREFCHFTSLSPNIYNFHFLKQGLHNTPELLRKSLQEAIDSVPEEYTAALIGYGLCCNGIEGIVARDKRLVFMRGHDCITFLLGSRECYREHAERLPGTYWYSPGWIETGFTPGEESFERLFREYTEKYGEDNARYLIDMEREGLRRYTTAAFVDLGFSDTFQQRAYTERCAGWLGLNLECVSGDPKLIRDFIDGRWNTDDFLVVAPGETVMATHDDRIITAKGKEADGKPIAGE
ncbi:MAG: DUF1638 domain-containing protein [Candidatus Latescibacterota bacterium]